MDDGNHLVEVLLLLMVFHALIDLLDCSFFSDLNESVWRDKSSHFFFAFRLTTVYAHRFENRPKHLGISFFYQAKAEMGPYHSVFLTNMFAPKLFASNRGKKGSLGIRAGKQTERR